MFRTVLDTLKGMIMYEDWTPNIDAIIVIAFSLFFWGMTALMIRRDRKRGR